jgi:hypothetical protein
MQHQQLSCAHPPADPYWAGFFEVTALLDFSANLNSPALLRPLWSKLALS